MSQNTAETDRAGGSQHIVGTIEAFDYLEALCRVRSGDWVSGWIPWQTFAAGRVRNWRPPSQGEQVIILSPSGQPEQGLVLAGFFTDGFPANDNRENITATDWPDGARERYDHDAHEYQLTVPAGGRIIFTIGQTTLTLTDGETKLETPKLTVDAPESLFTGTLTVQKLLTYLGGLAGFGSVDGGASAEIEGDIKIRNGDVEADGITLKKHTHTENGDGSETSAANP